MGDPERALVMLGEIEAQITTGSFGFHNWRWQLRLLHTRGLCFLVLKEPTKTLESADHGLKLAEINVTRKYIALNHELRGMALEKLGNLDQAISELETAISIADIIQYQPIRWAGRLKLADLHRQNNHQRDADKTLAEAENIIQTIAGAIDDDKLRTTFLTTALPQ